MMKLPTLTLAKPQPELPGVKVSFFSARRAELLHSACQDVVAAVQGGAQLIPSLRSVARRYRGRSLGRGRKLLLAMPTIRTLYYAWKLNPCPRVFLRRYKGRVRRTDPAKLELSVQTAASGRASVRAAIRAYRQADPAFSGCDYTLRRAVEEQASSQLETVRRLRLAYRAAKRRARNALLAQDRAYAELETARTRLGVQPPSIMVTVAGVHCTLSTGMKLLKMETDSGRMTRRQQQAVDELMKSLREAGAR